MVAIYTVRSDGTHDTRYLHKDHLGSTDVITDENGQVVERLSFDPFGKRRFPTWEDDPTGTLRSLSDRGFTGHREVDGVGLVHMGGRVYDPELGRFLSPDPIVQSMVGQGLNRYSYCLNNPLSSVDPTGYWGITIDIFKPWKADPVAGDFTAQATCTVMDDWIGIEHIEAGAFYVVGVEAGIDFSHEYPEGNVGVGVGYGCYFGMSGPTLNCSYYYGGAVTVGYDTQYGGYAGAWAGYSAGGAGVNARARYWFRYDEFQIQASASYSQGVASAGVTASYSKSGGFGYGANASYYGAGASWNSRGGLSVGASGRGVSAMYNFESGKIDCKVDPVAVAHNLGFIPSPEAIAGMGVQKCKNAYDYVMHSAERSADPPVLNCGFNWDLFNNNPVLTKHITKFQVWDRRISLFIADQVLGRLGIPTGPESWLPKVMGWPVAIAVGVLADPTVLSDPVRDSDGKWYYPDGTACTYY